jgi:hypothetical protein
MRSQRENHTTIVEIEPERLRRLRRLLADNVSFEQVWRELNTLKDRAAASTVEALMLGLGERGTAALKEAPVRQRLDQLSEAQLHEVCARLQKLKPEIARAWSPDEIERLVEAWAADHG